MVQLYLHAGLPKTATTAIQNWLTANRDALRQMHVFALAQPLAHRLAVAAITSPTRLAQADIPPILMANLSKAQAALAQATRENDIDRIIVSSEYFSVADPGKARSLLVEVPQGATKIILVLRRQDKIVASGYNQNVRMMGGTHRIREPNYNPRWDWYLLAKSWAEVFGRENIFLLLYDELIKNPTPIVSQIFEGIDSEIASFATEKSVKEALANQSLPATLIEFKRLANQAGATAVLPLLEAASRSGAFGKPFRLKVDVAKAFLDLYRESNRRVAREFLGTDNDLFDETDLHGDVAGADFTGNLPLETLAMLLALHVDETARRIQDMKTDAARRLEECEEALKQLRAELEATESRTSSPTTTVTP